MKKRQMKIIDGSPTAGNQILDTNQLAKFLGVSEVTVYRKRKEGLPHYKEGRKCYHLKDKVLRWFDDNQGGDIKMTTKMKLNIKQIKHLYLDKDMTAEEIAVYLEVSKTTILDRLNKMGITKPIGHANKTHGMKGTRLYRVWHGMKNRCLNSNLSEHYRYGGRGIEICDSWLNFENFMEWAHNNGYRDDLEIDRIDNDGNYEPKNCRFVTAKVNMNNRSVNRMITINNRTQTLTQWADEYNLSHETLAYRIKKGWPEDRLLKPTRIYKKRGK